MFMKLKPNQERAAALIAQGRSDVETAAIIGVEKHSIMRWRRSATFTDRIAAEAVAIVAAVKAEGIANRQNRIDAYNDRWRRMQTVIEERATDPQFSRVPGGKTGLITVTFRGVGRGEDFQLVEEYAVDTGLLKELREHEKQAAQDLGQWTEKQEHSGDGLIRIYEVDTTDGRSVPLPD